jgi:CheY-like chemotaxis protein
VKIYSEVGHGTSVRLYLPRAEQDVSSLKVASAEAAIRLPSGSETILVVEDDASVRAMATNTLQHLGYTVRQASEGKGALEILREAAHIDLLFTDMIMPNGMSGHDLIRAARQIRPSIKLLLTSGYSEQFIKPANNAPDVRLLGKPYRREKLATMIRATLDSSG